MNCNFISSVVATLLDSGGGTVTTVIQASQNTGFPFTENQAYIDPAPPFRRMRLTFSSSVCSRFFVDNLGYQPLVTPVEAQTFTVE